ncbi:MAG: N-acetyltransferase [Fuerstiella sp.]
MITIAQEEADHRHAIRQLTVAAFANSELGYNGEADFIDTLRNQCPDILSLVALDDDRVVGHILFSAATIRCGPVIHAGMGLAPMAVHPAFQKQGIGSILVTDGMKRLAKRNLEFTMVAGHAQFYPRFGFLPAAEYSVRHGCDGMPQDIFFLHTKHPRTQFIDGLAYYHDVFGTQHGSVPKSTDPQ